MIKPCRLFRRLWPAILWPALAFSVSLASAQERPELTIDVPGFSVTGREDAHLTVDVPDFIVIGRVPNEITVDVPDFTVTGRAEPEVKIDVPAFNILGRLPSEIDLIVPDMVIVGRARDDDEDDRDDAKTDRDIAQQLGEQEASLDTPENGPAAEADVARSLANLCHGPYTAHIGQGVGTAVGFVMPFGRTMQLPAKVDIAKCGAEISVTLQGQAVALSQGVDPRDYSGAINLGDGADRVLFLRCGADQNLRGALVAKDSNLRIERPIWLLHGGTPPEPVRCD